MHQFTVWLQEVKGKGFLLVSTAIASRVVALPQPRHIYTFDLPNTATDKLHRVLQVGVQRDDPHNGGGALRATEVPERAQVPLPTAALGVHVYFQLVNSFFLPVLSGPEDFVCRCANSHESY